MFFGGGTLLAMQGAKCMLTCTFNMVTSCVEFAIKVRHMPRRDMLLLFETPFQFIEFVLEHVRFALRTRSYSKHYNISWDIFASNVLPYGILDEKRDLDWKWRPVNSEIFSLDFVFFFLFFFFFFPRGEGGGGLQAVACSRLCMLTLHTALMMSWHCSGQSCNDCC